MADSPGAGMGSNTTKTTLPPPRLLRPRNNRAHHRFSGFPYKNPGSFWWKPCPSGPRGPVSHIGPPLLTFLTGSRGSPTEVFTGDTQDIGGMKSREPSSKEPLMKKLLLLGLPLVTLAGLNVWSQAVAEPAHIRGPGVMVREGTGPDLAADVRQAEIPAAAPAKSIATALTTTTAKNPARKAAKTAAKNPAAAPGAVPAPHRTTAPASPAPVEAASPDGITVFVPAAPALISSSGGEEDDGGSRGRGRGGKSGRQPQRSPRRRR